MIESGGERLGIRIHGHHVVMKSEFLSNPAIANAVRESPT